MGRFKEGGPYSMFISGFSGPVMSSRSSPAQWFSISYLKKRETRQYTRSTQYTGADNKDVLLRGLERPRLPMSYDAVKNSA